MSPLKKLHHLYRTSAAAKALFDDLVAVGETEMAAEVRAFAVRIEEKIGTHVTQNLGSKKSEEQLS